MNAESRAREAAFKGKMDDINACIRRREEDKAILMRVIIQLTEAITASKALLEENKRGGQ